MLGPQKLVPSVLLNVPGIWVPLTQSQLYNFQKNSCIIDEKCYAENEVSPSDPCLLCKPHADQLEWTTDAG